MKLIKVKCKDNTVNQNRWMELSDFELNGIYPDYDRNNSTGNIHVDWCPSYRGRKIRHLGLGPVLKIENEFGEDTITGGDAVITWEEITKTGGWKDYKKKLTSKDSTTKIKQILKNIMKRKEKAYELYKKMQENKNRKF